MKLNGNGNSISYKFDWDGAATTAKLYQFGFMDGWRSNSGKGYTSVGSKGSLGASGANFSVTWNSADVAIDATALSSTFAQLLADATVDAGDDNSKAGPCLIGEVSLAHGDNTFSFIRNTSYNLAVSDFVLVIE